MEKDPGPGEQRRRSTGEARPNFEDPDPRTTGGQEQERPEDRPMVGSVRPEDYPRDRPK